MDILPSPNPWLLPGHIQPEEHHALPCRHPLTRSAWPQGAKIQLLWLPPKIATFPGQQAPGWDRALQCPSLETPTTALGAGRPRSSFPRRAGLPAEPDVGWSLCCIALGSWLAVGVATSHRTLLQPIAAGDRASLPATRRPLVGGTFVARSPTVQAVGQAEDAVVEVWWGLALLLVGGFVLLALLGEVEGVAYPRRGHLPHGEHLQSQGFLDGLEGLEALDSGASATVPQDAALHHQVPLDSRDDEVTVQQVLALGVLQCQVVVIADQPLVASLPDVDVGGTRGDDHHEVVAVPGREAQAGQAIRQGTSRYNTSSAEALQVQPCDLPTPSYLLLPMKIILNLVSMLKFHLG